MAASDSPYYRPPNFGEAPYEESTGRRLLRAALAGFAGAAQVRPGQNFAQALGTGAIYSMNQRSAAEAAAQDYAQKQLDREAAREDRELRRQLQAAQIKQLEKPEKAEKADQTVVTTVGPDGNPVYTLRSDAVGKRAYVAPKTEGLVAIVGPSGAPVLVPQSQAKGKTPASGGEKPATAEQSKTAEYFERAQAAGDTVSQFESTYTGMGLGQLQQRYLPSAMQSPEQQAYNQAQREFITAKLRRESGAAIAQSEFDNEARTLFAQPGDSAKVLAQKKAARKRVIDGLRKSSGSALSAPAPSPDAGNEDPLGIFR